MGGNVTALYKAMGTETSAEKIPVKKIGRKEFTNKFTELFVEMNNIFFKTYKKKIWIDESKLVDGSMYNGSTTYIFDQTISDEEITKYKETAGDIDIIVPDDLKEEIWNMLDKLEGKEVVKGITYMGSNKHTVSAIGEQINGVFVAQFGESKVAAQVDFEFTEVDSAGTPSEWAKFSHSSSFEDAKKNIKAVHHKYLIQGLVGGASMRDDIAIATPSSRPDKIKLKKMKEGDIPRMLKFSVGRGIGAAYELMRDEDGKVIQIDGKDVYRELKTADRDYKTVVMEIYKLAFDRLEDNEKDKKLFGSFVGVVELCNKYLDSKQKERTFLRYIDKLFALGKLHAQELESHDKNLDWQVKTSGVEYLYKEIPELKKHKKSIDDQIEKYYAEWVGRKVKENFFREALHNVNYKERFDV